MTGQWEAYLHRIHRGSAQLAPFMEGIEEYVREVVGKVGQVPAAPRRPNGVPAPPAAVARPADAARGSGPEASPSHEDVVLNRAVPAPVYNGGTLAELLHTAFGFEQFRTSQEEVCRAVIEGRDVLLVMPTGSGKSLCYQLPAIARGGTTLVISPLIALMEDQVGKLKERGFAVARIHSGRDRADSRQACIDYLNGQPAIPLHRAGAAARERVSRRCSPSASPR